VCDHKRTKSKDARSRYAHWKTSKKRS
jgi:hypothetical protein